MVSGKSSRGLGRRAVDKGGGGWGTVFAVTQELFPIYKPVIGSWPFVLPTMTRQERRLVMENSFRPVFFFFFLRFQQRYKHPHFSQENKTCETYIQRGFAAFQAEKDYKSCCFRV